MARNAQASEGSWSTKILASIKISDTISWKAQRSVAPNGTTFLSVRKFATKKDGTEVPTKAAITLVADDTAEPNLKAILELLPHLKARGAESKSSKLPTPADLEEHGSDGGSVALINSHGDFLMKVKRTEGADGIKRKYVVTKDWKQALMFQTVKKAQSFGEKTQLFMLKSGWHAIDLSQPAKKARK